MSTALVAATSPATTDQLEPLNFTGHSCYTLSACDRYFSPKRMQSTVDAVDSMMKTLENTRDASVRTVRHLHASASALTCTRMQRMRPHALPLVLSMQLGIALNAFVTRRRREANYRAAREACTPIPDKLAQFADAAKPLRLVIDDCAYLVDDMPPPLFKGQLSFELVFEHLSLQREHDKQVCNMLLMKVCASYYMYASNI